MIPRPRGPIERLKEHEAGEARRSGRWAVGFSAASAVPIIVAQAAPAIAHAAPAGDETVVDADRPDQTGDQNFPERDGTAPLDADQTATDHVTTDRNPQGPVTWGHNDSPALGFVTQPDAPAITSTTVDYTAISRAMRGRPHTWSHNNGGASAAVDGISNQPPITTQQLMDFAKKTASKAPGTIAAGIGSVGQAIVEGDNSQQGSVYAYTTPPTDSAGTSSVEGDPTAPEIRAREGRGNKVYWAGDSLSVGLDPWLKAALESQGLELLDNDAVGGERFSDSLRHALNPENAEHIAQADLIVLGYSTNDTPAQVAENGLKAVREMHRAGSVNGIEPVIMLITPASNNPDIEAGEKIAHLERIAEQARQEGIDVVIHNQDASMERVGIDPSEDMWDDRVHFQSDANRRLADDKAKTIAQLLDIGASTSSGDVQATPNATTASIDGVLAVTDGDTPTDQADGGVAQTSEVLVTSLAPKYEIDEDGNYDITNIMEFLEQRMNSHESGNACMPEPWDVGGRPSHVFDRGIQQREKMGRPEHVAYRIAFSQIYHDLTAPGSEFPQYYDSTLGMGGANSGPPHTEHTDDNPAIDLTSRWIRGDKQGQPGPAFMTESDDYDEDFSLRLLEESYKIRLSGQGIKGYIIINNQSGLRGRVTHLPRFNGAGDIFTNMEIISGHLGHIHESLIPLGDDPMRVDELDPSNCADNSVTPGPMYMISINRPNGQPPATGQDDYPVVNTTLTTESTNNSSSGVTLVPFDSRPVTVVAPVEQSQPGTPRGQEVDSDGDHPYDPILDLISRGEGNYNSMNRGRSGDTQDTEAVMGKKLTDMTVGEIMDHQANGRMFAAGRYQIIPVTMRVAVEYSGVDLSERFSEEIQDKLGASLINHKRPAIGDYIHGRSDNEHAALVGLAEEWASLPHPDTGRSHYEGVGNNRHSLSREAVAEALNKTRDEVMSRERALVGSDIARSALETTVEPSYADIPTLPYLADNYVAPIAA